jgi:flagellar biosynthesis protein FlhF
MAEMLSEMRNMRSVIESQLTTIAWGNIQQRDPIKSQVLNTLLSAGFSASLARLLAEKMPANLDIDKATAWIKNILAINLNTIETETEVLDQGGIFALIGPTGVGKTTTTAKLAARYVMKHGTQNIGLITTDAYRIGGHEQLRIYGKILGVMVHAVKDEADLKIALNELKNKHTILIDTVGVSQRDRMVAEQIAMLSNTTLSNTKAPIKKLLCLNATSTGETLTDVIRAYKGKGLDGCIITKLDEAATIGNALDVTIREKLKLYYIANGQRVPEDIHMANKRYLIQLALQTNTANNRPFQLMNEELPYIMGNTVNAANTSDLLEINYG